MYILILSVIVRGTWSINTKLSYMLSFNKSKLLTAARQTLKFNIEGPNVKYTISIKKKYEKKFNIVPLIKNDYFSYSYQ